MRAKSKERERGGEKGGGKREERRSHRHQNSQKKNKIEVTALEKDSRKEEEEFL